MDGWTDAERRRVRARQGPPIAGVDIRVVDDAGEPVPWDGKSVGELEVRGPWIAASYYDDPARRDAFHDGWFRTGDVVNVDPRRLHADHRRAKDVIKSGGEWISSVELENAIRATRRARGGRRRLPHERWQERPLACVVPKPGRTCEGASRLSRSRVAKWWLPRTSCGGIAPEDERRQDRQARAAESSRAIVACVAGERRRDVLRAPCDTTNLERGAPVRRRPVVGVDQLRSGPVVSPEDARTLV
jgi:acyl-CoA synthetase (AMP-forming)/AMP-acid ligase II